MALAASAAIGGGMFAWTSRTLPIRSLTVGTFTVESGPEWLAGSITEEIADAARPFTQASAEPKFTAVLDGRVARSGDRLRVTAALTRGDGHRYWTRTIDRPLVDAAREVAAAAIPAVRKKAPRHKPATAAYERYLEGRQLLARQAFAQAIDAFDAAAQADPEFAAAFAWAALAREQLAQTGVRPNDVMPAARDDAERAVTLAPEAAEPHLALGVVKLQYDWDWDTAGRELDRALELSPRHPLATEWRNRWLQAMNRAPAAALVLPNAPHDAEAARRLLADADEVRSRAYVSPIVLALAANLAGDLDGLFHWLDVAYDERSVQLPCLVRNPALPQADPRLRELIRRLKLPTTP
jgi:tetratricopeptide (TPR) repeat protein